MKKPTTLRIYCGATALLSFGIAFSAFAQQEGNRYISPQAQEYRGPSDPEARRGATHDRARDTEARERREPETRAGRMDPRDFTQNAQDLIGQQVENNQGEPLGTIENIVIDVNSGQVEFLAVGPGDPLRVVPPQAFQPETAENILVLDVDGNTWEDAPTFNRAELRRLAQERDAREVYRYYDRSYRSAERTDQAMFGAPAHRGHGASRVSPRGRFPGETQASRADAPTMPQTRGEVHPDMRGAQEYGSPGERNREQRAETEWRNRSAARDIDADEPREYGAPDRAEEQWEEKPHLRNPRLQHSHRGRRSDPGAPEEVTEFGARDRQASSWERSMVPREERLQWISDLVGQPVTDSDNQSIGSIEDFILNLRTGQAEHAIVSHEQEQFAIPMREVQIDENRQVNVRPTLSRLQQAPRYNANRAARQPQQAFRYESPQSSEFGAPAREEEAPESP